MERELSTVKSSRIAIEFLLRGSRKNTKNQGRWERLIEGSECYRLVTERLNDYLIGLVLCFLSPERTDAEVGYVLETALHVA